MKVPLLDLDSQNGELRDSLNAAFEQVLNSSQFILGPQVADFEQAVAERLGTNHAIGVSSGTDALLIALMALDIQPGDEVLCPSFTFFATAGCISRLGAIPVFVDSQESDFQINIEDAEAKVTANTKAILPVHLFGQTADMDRILEFSRKHNLKVVEDCAQSMGALWKGREAGTMGDLGTFSFFPTKNLGGFGDGGLVTTNDPDLAERLCVLRAHGSKPKYYHSMVGGNFRLDALQAALLKVKLPNLSGYIDRRRENAAYYFEKFEDHKDQLAGKILLPTEMVHCRHTWNQFTIRVTEGKRDDLRLYLNEQGIASEIYYPLALHQQECFSDLPAPTCPVAEKLTREVLSIPIYPELSRVQQDAVVVTILKFLDS